MRVDALSLRLGDATVLDAISFSVTAGESVAVLGANGAGKSMLLRVCHGLLAPTSGRVVMDAGSAIRQAMVFQRPVLLRRSVHENLRFALPDGLRSTADGRERVAAVLEAAQLSDLGDRQARLLSGGEQQRAALARAMVMDPDVVWLDEPTANLDPTATRGFERTLAALQSRGCTTVLTTHDVGQARRLADRVLFLHRGRLLEDSAAAAFFVRPGSEVARRYLAGDLVD